MYVIRVARPKRDRAYEKGRMEWFLSCLGLVDGFSVGDFLNLYLLVVLHWSRDWLSVVRPNGNRCVSADKMQSRRGNPKFPRLLRIHASIITLMTGVQERVYRGGPSHC